MSLFALCLGYFIVIIDIMIVNIALPSISHTFSSNLSDLQWVIDGYTLMFTCFLPSAGSLGDKVGARTGFLIGLIFFILTSISCGLAPTMNILIISRVMQGIAAAFIVPTSIALINASYPDKKERIKALGLWATLGGVAAASGPILGAVITTYLGWRGIFFINLPIGLIAIILTLRYVVKPPAKLIEKFDFLGQVSLIISLGALAFALIEAGKLGWDHQQVIGSAIIFFFSGILFLWWENRTNSPVIPLNLFHSASFTIISIIATLVNFSYYGVVFMLPLYFQQQRHYSILNTGLILVPLVLFSPISSYFSSKVTAKFGARLPLIMGLTLGAIGYICLLNLIHSTSFVYSSIFLAMIGIGTTFAIPAAVIAVNHSVPSERVGIASGLFNTNRQLGSLLGVAIFGTIITIMPSFSESMQINFILAGSIYLISVFLSLFIKG